MRISALMVLLLLIQSTAPRQVPKPMEPEQVVRVALAEASQGISIGFTETLVSRLGDAAAVGVTKVFADQKLSEKDIKNIVDVIRMAFLAPHIVEIEADRQPRTTLFVLQHLELITKDAETKMRIRDTKAFVIEQANKASEPK